ncbi:MAG: hypothetical protein C4335_12465 [Armatimonadota bacterium]
MGQRAIAVCLVLALAVAVWAEGENSPCAKLLPSAGLKGWKEVNGSYLYGKGEGLTSIYDGGYQLYLQHGVQEAAQKLYQRGDLYVTVTVHTMKDTVSARKFVQYWREAHGKHKPQALKLVGTGFWVQAEGATTLYWAKGRFFVTVMASGSDRQSLEAGLALLKAVASKVR